MHLLNLTIVALIAFTPIAKSAQRILLKDISVIKKSDNKEVKYEQCTVQFGRVFNLEKGEFQLKLLIKNTSNKQVKILKSDLGLDESYFITYDGKLIPNGMNNHQMIDEVNKIRDKMGIKWISLGARESIEISLDMNSWPNLVTIAADKSSFKVKLYSNLFRGDIVELKLTREET